MNHSLGDYLKAAFNARPWGMFLPPNWLGLAAFGILGFWEPGFWMLGAGLEMGYLLVLSHQPRFRALVDGEALLTKRLSAEKTQLLELARLDKARQERFRGLQKKCSRILEDQHLTSDSSLQQIQRDGLGRLQSIHLKLLLVQADMEKMLAESGTDPEFLHAKIENLKAQIESEPTSSELNKSRSAQMEILEKRFRALREGGEKLRFAESELTRIEEQVALIGDEVRLASAPEAIGSQIDRISDGLEETNHWLSEQRKLFADSENIESASASLQTQ